MTKRELYYLSNLCYYDFDGEESCVSCPRFSKCRDEVKNKIESESEQS
jgi:hypothetical protein